ncbi:MAG: sialidase family protein [Pirellulaceae bacterium]|nr:exo-alpha-sialidase [Planctomycetales bacterium]
MFTYLLVALGILVGQTPLGWAQPLAGPEGAGVDQVEFIYDEAPFPECHASTIEQTTKGTLVTAWFGGTEERHPDVGIWVSRLSDGKWSFPVEVANGVQADGQRFPTWNPVLFQPQDGPLMLFFKVGPSPREWWGEWMVSSDDGVTWQHRARLPNQGIGPVKNKPVQLADGTIVAPSSTEDNGWQIHVELTRDLGKNWTKIGPLNGDELGAIQPTILLHGQNRLQMLSRDRNGQGNIWQCWSEDGGKSWGEITSLGLPNPNSGIDAVTLKDGRHLLVYNHTVRGGPFPSGRDMLNVAVSRDGRSWEAALTLERVEGEFSYPAVIQSRDGMVHITYTWNRQRVRHVVVDPAKLKLHPVGDFDVKQ